MKRDMELIKRILLLIEENDDDSKKIHVPDGVNVKDFVYHLKILEQAGYIDRDIFYGSSLFAVGLTIRRVDYPCQLFIVSLFSGEPSSPNRLTALPRIEVGVIKLTRNKSSP